MTPHDKLVAELKKDAFNRLRIHIASDRVEEFIDDAIAKTLAAISAALDAVEPEKVPADALVQFKKPDPLHYEQRAEERSYRKAVEACVSARKGLLHG